MGENYFGLTDPGRQRTNNEDRFIAQPAFGGKLVIACVIDGVGGYAGGEVAAELTRDEIIAQLKKIPENILDKMVGALQDANERIIKEKEVNPQNEKMACVVTLALADINRNTFYFAHVGDTRLYLFRDGSLIKVTKDHSTVGFLEESGRLTEEAAMQHPKRNEVNKALGYEPHIALTKDFIDTGESPFLPGDMILLCSDGLSDMVASGTIISVLSSETSLKAKASTLIDLANEAGGKDNITVVLVHNDKLPVQHAATKPAAVALKKNNNEDEQVKVNEPLTDELTPVEEKSSGQNINRLLLWFGILSFLGFAWMLYKHYEAKPIAQVVATPVPMQPQRNQQELAFLDSINKNSIVKLTAAQPIIVTDALLIKNDSLQIIGNGTVFISDSSYKGPAFILAPNCRYVVLDSITIQNFNVGIMAQGRGLKVKNVRFKNCNAPMQFQQQIVNDTIISGKQADTVFYRK